MRSDDRRDRFLLWLAVRWPSRSDWLRGIVTNHRIDRAHRRRDHVREALRGRHDR